ncbi:hypothetical protein Pcinc_029952 [Petrolisthes cinctipes]|uniref:C1q domain-containing protein n=1 Tax=Petrolisthes cinctipes TaxID=88211 RepID=A0AAE1EZA0_PETCI|nr:hypothetical protein Pcinc_029952 [Petrolisthes cinctipes]
MCCVKKASLILLGLFVLGVTASPFWNNNSDPDMTDEMDDDDYMNDNDTDTDDHAQETSADYDDYFDKNDDDLEETSYHGDDNDDNSTETDDDGGYASETQFFAPPRPRPVNPSTKIAFTVRKVRGRRTATTILRFQNVLTNAGGAWRNDRFTAPRNGLYYFAFHAVGGRTSDFTMSLIRNGVYRVTAYGTSNTFEHGSNSAVLRLRSGDRVQLRLTQGTIYEHPGSEAYTSFTGFQI